MSVALKTTLAFTGTSDGNIVDELLSSKDDNKESIQKLRDNLQFLVTQLIEDEDKISDNGFVFFIDDLDRIDPKLSVEILEMLKNIFDIKHCIFVLALDYDVVVKGLQHKFQHIKDINSREYRHFFDKIIQLPFSVPVSKYDVKKIISEHLKELGFTNLDEKLSKYKELTEDSVGKNPRGLKRLFNVLSLTKIINDDNLSETSNEIILYGVVCLQIAYPEIYNLIDSHLQSKYFIELSKEDLPYNLKYKNNKDNIKEKLSEEEEEEEEWKFYFYAICEANPFLLSRYKQIIDFLVKLDGIINDNVKKDGNAEDKRILLSNILKISSITNVKSSTDQSNIRATAGDRSKANPDLNQFTRKFTTKANEEQILENVEKYPNNKFKQHVYINQGQPGSFSCKLGCEKELFAFFFIGSRSNSKVKFQNLTRISEEFDNVYTKSLLERLSSISGQDLSKVDSITIEWEQLDDDKSIEIVFKAAKSIMEILK